MTAMLRFGLRRRYFPAPRSCNIAINLATAAGHHFFAPTRRITGGYQFFVEDVATGNSQALNAMINNYSGDSAEVIAERPKVSGQVTSLSNFGTLTFTQSLANGERHQHLQPVGRPARGAHGEQHDRQRPRVRRVLHRHPEQLQLAMLVQARGAARLLPVVMLAGCLAAVPAVARAAAVAPAIRAPAAAGWARPVRLSAPGDLAASPRVTIGGRGTAVAVWAQLHGGGADYVVMTSTRPPGGSWTPPVRLSAPGQFAFSPAVAVSPAGGAVVVWSAAGTGGPGLRGQAVMAAVRGSPGQRWSRPVQLSRGGVAGEQARVAMDGHGHATAIWASGGNGPGRIQTATLNMAGGRWSRPVLLAAARQPLLDPQIAASPRGDLVAAWKRLTGGAPLGPQGVRAQISATVRPAGSRSWLPVTALGPELELPGQDSAAPELPGPQVAIDAAGDAAVSWQGLYRRTAVPEVSLRTAGRRWQKPARLATATGVFPSVAADGRGDLTALWEGAGGRVQTASRPVHAPVWSTPRTLFRGNPGIGSFPQLATGPRGETVAAWGGNMIRAAMQRNPAGAWSRPVLLGSGGLAQLATGARGDAIVVWQQPVRHPAGTVVQAARFSPAGPG